MGMPPWGWGKRLMSSPSPPSRPPTHSPLTKHSPPLKQIPSLAPKIPQSAHFSCRPPTIRLDPPHDSSLHPQFWQHPLHPHPTLISSESSHALRLGNSCRVSSPLGSPRLHIVALLGPKRFVAVKVRAWGGLHARNGRRRSSPLNVSLVNNLLGFGDI